MDGLFASMAVKWACDKLSALLPASLTSSPAAPSSSAGSQEDLENLRLLERTMRRIHATLDDAEDHWNIREESAKLRLRELKELAYDAEDVVDEYEYEVNRRKVEQEALQFSGFGGKRKRQEVRDGDSIDAGIVSVPSDLAVRARRLVERFSEIKDYSKKFSLSDNDGERRVVPDINTMWHTSSFVYAPKILGRENDKRKIIERGEGKHIGDDQLSILAIVGRGGLGKTTLAQLVYDDLGSRQSFDMRAWVCVTDNFDVKSLTQKIISSVTKEKCTLSELADLQKKLVNKIKGKKFFPVLDDVWNERRGPWELLCMPLLAAQQCKVVVTTLNEAVARLVQTIPFYTLDFLCPYQS